MKAIILLTLLYSTHVFSQGIPNPQLRICLNIGADFWALDIQKPKTDNIGFCKFNTSSMIGSLSLIDYFHYSSTSKAIFAYISTKNKKVSKCSSVDAIETLAIDSNQEFYKLCVFEDYSFILKNTLVSGFNHPKNQALNKALYQSL